MSGHRQDRADSNPGRPWWRRINWQPVIGVLLIVAAAYSAGSTYQQGEQNQQRSECQTALNAGFLASLQARDVAARESSSAQRALLSVPSTATEKQKADARSRYVDSLTELDRVRAVNPLPGQTTC